MADFAKIIDELKVGDRTWAGNLADVARFGATAVRTKLIRSYLTTL